MVVLMTSYCLSAQGSWVTDMNEAKTLASESNKIILMSFQGSDWCGSCKRLDRQLFQSEEFKTFAEEHLILLKLDFPMRKENQLSKEQTTHNEALADIHNPEGAFPKVLLFSAEGERLGAMSYPSKSNAEYLESIKSFK